MKKWVPTIIFLLAILCSCGKKDSATCPVNYAVDGGVRASLIHQWGFVGFVDTLTGKTDSPLCGNIESDITFTDSVIPTHTAPFYTYRYLYYGTALINYYSGSYTPATDSSGIQLSVSQKTTITGTDDVQKFETRFHTTLQQVTAYHINHNELTLFPAGSTVVMRFKSND